MSDEKLLLRDSWQEAWELAVDLTIENLQQADLQERCKKSGGIWSSESRVVEMPFLNRVYQISPPGFEVHLKDDGQVPITDRILILHYLQTAAGISASGEWITFAQIPGGEIYLPVFRARSVDRLVRAFNGREETLVDTARAIGGVKAEYGDVSVKISAFPNVPVLLTLWRGDDEFPASGNLLFDATVTKYLPMEDVVVLAGIIAGQLCKKGASSV